MPSANALKQRPAIVPAAATDSRLVTLPTVGDERGLLTFAEAERHVPFEVKRIFYLHEVPTGKSRGAHAHKQCEQFILVLGGSCEVRLDDGLVQQTFQLNSANVGLYVAPMTWCEIHGLSPGATCLVLASERYDESDYLRVYDDFLRAKGL